MEIRPEGPPRCRGCPNANRRMTSIIPEVVSSSDDMNSKNVFTFIKGAFRYIKAQKHVNRILQEDDERGSDCNGPIEEAPNDPSNPTLLCGMSVRETIADSFSIEISDNK